MPKCRSRGSGRPRCTKLRRTPRVGVREERRQVREPHLDTQGGRVGGASSGERVAFGQTERGKDKKPP